MPSSGRAHEPASVNRVPSVNDSLYADALAPFLAEARRLRPRRGGSDRRAHPPRPGRGRALARRSSSCSPSSTTPARGAPACFRCTTPSAGPPTASPTTASSRGRQKARAGSLRSAVWTRPKIRSPRASAAWRRARAASSCTRAPRTSCSTARRCDAIFALAERAGVPILIHAGRGLPPLADGLADLALSHPGVVLILAHGAICDQGILTSRLADHPGVLYDISCFFPLDVIELFARVPPSASCSPPTRPTACPPPRSTWRCASPPRPASTRPPPAGVLGATMAGLLDGHGLPPVTPPRRGPSITLSGRLARVYGYAQPHRSGAVRRACPNRRWRCSRWRSPPAATPSPAMSARRSRRSARRSAPPRCCCRRQDGVRPAIDLVYRAIVRAATELPRPARLIARPSPSPPRSARRAAHSPLLAALALAQPQRAANARRRSRRPRRDSRPPAIRCSRGTLERVGQIEQQRPQQVREHHAGTALPVRRRPAVAAQIEAAHLDLHTVRRARFAPPPATLDAVVVERQHRVDSRAVAAAIASTPEPVPRSSSPDRRAASRVGQRPSSSSRHSRVVACAPVPNACPGRSRSPAAPAALGGRSQGGRTCSAGSAARARARRS